MNTKWKQLYLTTSNIGIERKYGAKRTDGNHHHLDRSSGWLLTWAQAFHELLLALARLQSMHMLFSMT